MGSGTYIFGPIVAFIVIGALALVLRWSFDSNIARKQAEIFADPGNYGLLTVAAVVETTFEARAMQQRLSEAGIRATLAPADDGRVNVLVFEADAEEARRVVNDSTR